MDVSNIHFVQEEQTMLEGGAGVEGKAVGRCCFCCLGKRDNRISEMESKNKRVHKKLGQEQRRRRRIRRSNTSLLGASAQKDEGNSSLAGINPVQIMATCRRIIKEK